MHARAGWKTLHVKGVSALRSVAAVLIAESRAFEVEPRPNDRYGVRVKDENFSVLVKNLDAILGGACVAAKEYQAPTGNRIGRVEGTRRLYALEEARDEAIQEAAHELGSVLGHQGSDFFTVTMPEALLSVLDAFDQRAAYEAARAFVVRHMNMGGV